MSELPQSQHSSVPHWGQWVENRSRIAGFRHRVDLAAAVGCTRQQLSNWLLLSVPPATMRKGFGDALAAALRLDKATLFEDWANFEPRDIPVTNHNQERTESPASPAMLSDLELMTELLRRRRLAHINLAEKLDQAEKTDWASISRQLQAIPSDHPIPPDLMECARLAHVIRAGIGSERHLAGQWEAYQEIARLYSDYVNNDPHLSEFQKRIRLHRLTAWRLNMEIAITLSLWDNERQVEEALPTGGRSREEIHPIRLIDRGAAIQRNPHFWRVVDRLQATAKREATHTNSAAITGDNELAPPQPVKSKPRPRQARK